MNLSVFRLGGSTVGLQLNGIHQLLVNYISGSVSHVSTSTASSTNSTASSSPASRTRESMGRSTTSTLPSTLSAVDFPTYLPFVNRQRQCDTCLKVFQSLYEVYCQQVASMKRNALTREDILINSNNEDVFRKEYPIVICGGAPGVGRYRHMQIVANNLQTIGTAGRAHLWFVMCMYILQVKLHGLVMLSAITANLLFLSSIRRI